MTAFVTRTGTRGSSVAVSVWISAVILAFAPGCSDARRKGSSTSAPGPQLAQSGPVEIPEGPFPARHAVFGSVQTDKGVVWLWGFMDSAGKVVIPFQFDQVGGFFYGAAPVCKNGRWGYIDCDGKVIVSLRHDSATPMLAGVGVLNDGGRLNLLAMRAEGGQWTIVTPNGEVTARLDDVAVLSIPRDGRIAYTKDGGREGRWGFLDYRGQTVIPPRYGLVSSFSDGLAYASLPYEGRPRGPYMIDRDGNVLIDFLSAPFSTTHVRNVFFSEGLLAAHDSQSAVFVDREGKIAARLPKGLRLVGGLSDGLAIVKKDGLYGFVNREGEVVIEPQFKEVRRFYEDRAFVRRPGQDYEVIEKSGRTRFRLKPNDMSFDRDEMCDYGGPRGTVPRSGFLNGVAKITSTTGDRYVDRDGHTIYENRLSNPEATAELERLLRMMKKSR